jgi:AcrR family transcriptional regulator
MSAAPPVRRPDVTRQKLLDAAFEDFYRAGFQGGSLSRIVAAAGVTKGALFHHFAGKHALGYAVVDEVIASLMTERWVAALESAADPVSVIQSAFRRYTREDIDSGAWTLGCPLNNLAQEMSPLDVGFRERIDALYGRWRAELTAALSRGMEAGVVRRDTVPGNAAALLVASQMGVWGTGKSSRDAPLMLQACEAVCDYLERLRS